MCVVFPQMPSKKRRDAEALISCASVRHTVHSMARLMASYYGNKQMFVYPPHAAKKLPPLHVNYALGKILFERTRRIYASLGNCFGYVHTCS